ncbi:unnamed protein product, partial [marine sediment metagenome]
EEIEAELAKQAKEREGKLTWKRVSMPLFDLRDPENKQTSGYITIRRAELLYSWWSKRDDFSLRQRMELNVKTGKTIPW